MTSVPAKFPPMQANAVYVASMVMIKETAHAGSYKVDFGGSSPLLNSQCV